MLLCSRYVGVLLFHLVNHLITLQIYLATQWWGQWSEGYSALNHEEHMVYVAII